MKKAGQIVLLVGGLLYALFGLVWLGLILLSLFRLDPSIYAEPLYGYLGLSLRIIRCLFYLSLGVLAVLLLRKNEHPVLRIYVFVFAVASFALEEVLSGLASMKGDVSFLGQFVPLIFAIVYLSGALLYYWATKPAKPVGGATVSTKEPFLAKPVDSEGNAHTLNAEAVVEVKANALRKGATKKVWSIKTKAGKK